VILLDVGANPGATAELLVQFALAGAAFARVRLALDVPRVGLLNVGTEPGKGDAVRRSVEPRLEQALRSESATFAGNVEADAVAFGGVVDVVVTDGFTGNVALKTLEGSLRFFMRSLATILGHDDGTRAAADALLPHLAPLAEEFDPDNTGGAMLLGLDGVCVISHGSSSARAVVSAVKVAHDVAEAGLVGRLAAALAGTGEPSSEEGSSR
jgi:glycerol-3-phosphate acyltransferase PlsX